MSARIKLLLGLGCLVLSGLMLPEGIAVLTQSGAATRPSEGTSPWAGTAPTQAAPTRTAGERVARVPFDLALRAERTQR